MTERRPQLDAPLENDCGNRTRRWREPLMVAIAAASMSAAGCAGSVAQIKLPAKAVATPATISAPVAMTPRQQVIAALVGYTAALAQADESRSSSSAREFLRPYLAASRIDGLVQAMNAIWARGERFYGADELHVSSVALARWHAFVHDCDDTSGMGLVDIATGQIVPGSAGTSRADLVTRLDLVSGHWLVQFQLVEDVPCTP